MNFKNNNTIIAIKILLLFSLFLTNCKNSSKDAEPAKEYNVKIVNGGVLIDTIHVISYDNKNVVLNKITRVNFASKDSISYDFNKCYKISMNIVAPKKRFVNIVTISRNNKFVESFYHWGETSSKYEYWL